jgi:hypothetical protein
LGCKVGAEVMMRVTRVAVRGKRVGRNWGRERTE